MRVESKYPTSAVTLAAGALRSNVSAAVFSAVVTTLFAATFVMSPSPVFAVESVLPAAPVVPLVAEAEAPQADSSTKDTSTTDTSTITPQDSASTALPDSVSRGIQDTRLSAGVEADSARQAIDTVAAPQPEPKATEPAPARRRREVRESTVHTIDELKGSYRSPKKALFMSLLVPGLGQAYVGHYVRGGAYFIADIGLALGWHHYVVVRHREQVTRYRGFADRHWSSARYEDRLYNTIGTEEQFKISNPHRDAYCLSIYRSGINAEKNLLDACAEPYDANKEINYRTHRAQTSQFEGTNGDLIQLAKFRRETIAEPHNFYEVIGKYNEFASGWEDVQFNLTDTVATSAQRSQYLKMRGKANDYSRMQAMFLGGMVLNHMVSALDAAIAAQLHNRRLYQTEVRWYERVRLHSDLVFDGMQPRPSVAATLRF